MHKRRETVSITFFTSEQIQKKIHVVKSQKRVTLLTSISPRRFSMHLFITNHIICLCTGGSLLFINIQENEQQIIVQ